MNTTDKIEWELAAGPLRCERPKDCTLHNSITGWMTCEICQIRPAVAAYVAKREEGLREQMPNHERAAERARAISSALGIVDESTSKQVAAIDALHTENEKLRAMEKAARAYVLAHGSSVVRMQDATLAQVYEDRARALDAALAAIEREKGET